MSRTLVKALMWGTGAGLATNALFGPLSFAVAHGSGWPIFFGAVLAIEWDLPGAKSLVGVGAYQFVYCLVVAAAVAGVVGVFRIRAERLEREGRNRGAT
jgi:hypothetical protein